MVYGRGLQIDLEIRRINAFTLVMMTGWGTTRVRKRIELYFFQRSRKKYKNWHPCISTNSEPPQTLPSLSPTSNSILKLHHHSQTERNHPWINNGKREAREGKWSIFCYENWITTWGISIREYTYGTHCEYIVICTIPQNQWY